VLHSHIHIVDIRTYHRQVVAGKISILVTVASDLVWYIQVVKF